MRIKVAHVINEYLGHTLNWVYTQIEHSNEAKHYVLTGLVKNIEIYPVRVFSPPKPPNVLSLHNRVLIRLGFMPFSLYACYLRSLTENPPDLVFAHFGNAGFFILGLKAKLKLPLITRFYGFDIGILPRRKLWRKRYKKLFRDGELFLVEGETMKSKLLELGCPEEKVVVNHLGINMEKILYIEREYTDKKIRILIASTFKEKKGIRYALEALSIAKQAMPHTELCVTIIGDGELKDELHQLAKQLNLSSNIEWAGYQPHEYFVESLYCADIFLSASVTSFNGDTEGGVPVAIIEAAASGLPVISTTHADIPEVVLNGVTGLLSPERDSRSLAESITTLSNSPALRREYGIAARSHVSSNYDAKEQGMRLMDIYKGVVERFRGENMHTAKQGI